MTIKYLEGPRIYLRPVEPSDVGGDYLTWVNDPTVTKFLDVGAVPTNLVTLQRYVEKLGESPDHVFLAIIRKEDDRHVGNIKLGPINWVHRRAYLGLLLGDPSSRGKGLGGEAIELVLEHGFRTLNLHRIELGCYAAHSAAVALYQKLGFTIEGRIREEYYKQGLHHDIFKFGMLYREWVARVKPSEQASTVADGTEAHEMKIITHFEKSDAFRARIHDLIPGGAHTYSKGDDQFPKVAPAAIVRGLGSRVWDVDGNEFLDCSMGLTSVGLGHAYEPVVRRVADELSRGVNFQRPSILELQYAEAFLAQVPGHDMVKFAKNGSTVTTAATKIARGITGRKLVAFPGDHPFYSYDDWFIGKGACNRGIPQELAALSVTFKAYDLPSLKELFEKYPGQIACVITEPEKNFPIPEDFLKDALELTHREGALFIVDEMITGFKTAMPGSSSRFGVIPDLSTWGKGIGNGFSVCALSGKREVMEVGGIRRTGDEKLFLISTTHGAETHSLAAGLAVLDCYVHQEDVIGHNHAFGRALVGACSEEVRQAKLTEHVEIVPCDWQPLFLFKNRAGDIDNGYRTLMLQEMIRRGVLFQGIFSPCLSHNQADLAWFREAFKESLGVYSQALEDGFQRHLVGEPTKPVFRKFI